jgi:S1-C subfamily serine protease
MPVGMDLTRAAALGKSAVVFIYNFDSDTATVFSGQQTGSGVIISEDGYIVTNQHVINGAVSIFVFTDDKREFTAKLIGADTSRDVALIKIEAQGLPFLSYGNSDSVLIGEQVLAVGSPLRLQSTVTSGIVSARERTIKLGNNSSPYYIQTDVPLNVGNSGGALVNARGELIGLNIAYLSISGAYEGFSFAIPGNLVKKITTDIRDYSATRKGSLDIAIRNVTKDDAAAAGMTSQYGVVIDALTSGGEAERAGLQSLDILLSIDGKRLDSKADLQEQVSIRKPGDVVRFEVNRGGKFLTIGATLK